MRSTISALPDTPEPTGTSTTPAGRGWLSGAWAEVNNPAIAITAIAIAAVAVGALATYLAMRRPGKTDLSKHLMYAPLLLVNAAAIYGQVAFFYEQVAPQLWPTLGKVALAVVVAGAVESVAVYVGWHAHDALLMKAGVTAARLRRASYLIAGAVGAINYAHFAGDGMAPTAASFAFGLLSLLSPWLWGLHTRRTQHVQLLTEGVIDGSGATFSAERVRMYPIRTYMARRWSVDNNVSDPDAAWEGYKAHRATQVSDTTVNRVRRAWLVLTGQQPTPEPGHAGRVRVDTTTGQSADTQPDTTAVTAPDTPALPAPDSVPDDSAATPSGGSPDTAPVTVNGRRPDTTTPAPRAPRPPRHRTPDRTPKWSKEQLKAFRLRDTRADMTYPLIAREVGVSEKTVSRWFKARESSESGDDAGQERPPMTGLDLPVTEPKELVLTGTNGHHFTPGGN